MTYLLRAIHIGKSFGATPVLDDVSLAISQGDVACVIGAPRSGKTTLLRCLNLLDHIDQGFVEYGGLRVIEGHHANGTAASTNGSNGLGSKRPRQSRADKRAIRIRVDENHLRRKIGFVSQTADLLPAKTVLQNVIEGPVRVLGVKRSEAAEHAHELLRMVEMLDHETDFPTDLSLAQRRRVALARAMAMKPEVLLVDELTTGIYPSEAADLLELIRRIQSSHQTALVMVAHHLEFTRSIADQVMYLEQGRIVERGTPRTHP